MIDKIVAQLKTGTIKNVIPYGSSGTPEPPYIVVRGFAETGGKRYSVFVHMEKDQQIFLENYITKDVSDLLDGFASTTRHGNYNEIETTQENTDIIENDDGTISMERSFFMPSILF